MDRPLHLPDFDEPPLYEVAVSIQFQQIVDFGFVDIGLLWERFRDRFPRVEYHPPIASVFETFGLGAMASQNFQINFGQLTQLPRTWFIAQSGNEIVQVQSDRLVHNWRKVEVNNVYPHYGDILGRFASELDEFQSFLTDRDLGRLVPNQCELTYVNVIALPEGEADPVGSIFRGWNSTSGSQLGHAEDVAFTVRFLLKGGDNELLGRVIVQATPGFDQSGKPSVQLTLIGRGAPLSADLTGALEFMNLAHEKIVTGFAELTTDAMHRIWKRRT